MKILKKGYIKNFNIRILRNITCVVLILFLAKISVQANVKLPSVLSDNMVIQQETNVSIWGWAEPGEKVTVQGSWQGSGESVITDEKGHWLVNIKSPEAGGPYSISIQGKNKIVLQNVLSGEVWFASGQSNMAFALKYVEDAEDVIKNADYPEIRLFHVPRTFAGEPQEDCEGSWKPCSSEVAEGWGAAPAYFFARKIHQELKVPVGIISASKGGSPCEAWIQKEVIDNDSGLSEINDMWERWEKQYENVDEDLKKEYETFFDSTQDIILSLKKLKQPVPQAMDMVLKKHRRPGFLYNAMVTPIIPYTIKGVIWYQGENNVPRPAQYQKLFPALIQNWRDLWKLGNFPFYFVQIAPFNYKDDNVNAALLREAQTMSLSVPNTGMAVTSDVGNIEDIHPIKKQEVGYRLALWALAKTYGFDNLEYSGPVYKSHEIEGDTLRISFEHTGSGLMVKGDKLTCFELAGYDQKFHEAEAFIEENMVKIFSRDVADPVAVRFGWNITDEPNFFNAEGIPAVPFRTDQWNQ